MLSLSSLIVTAGLLFSPPADTVLTEIVGDTAVARSIEGQVAWLNEWEGADIEPIIIAHIIRVESGGDSTAVGALGELGVGQVRPEYWLGIWPECGTDLRSTRTGVCYTIRIYRYWRDKLGSRYLALRAYNGCEPGDECPYTKRVLNFSEELGT